MDIDTDKEDLENLYNNIDLSNKLIIFDDVDKTELDLESFFNYVTGLTLEDGVKVLLIMNDAETASIAGNIAAAMKQACSNILRYDPDIPFVIQNVLAEYQYPVLNNFLAESVIKEIEQCFKDRGLFSISSLFFACQKSVDLYRLMDAEPVQYDPGFLKTIFMGILLFSLLQKTDASIAWEDEDLQSFRLGSNQYPLFRFCYNYITQQLFDPIRVNKTQKLYKEFQIYDRIAIVDPDLSILYTWYCQKETDLLDTIARITERLQDPMAFPLQEYGRIACSLLRVEQILHCDIAPATERMISNLAGNGLVVNSDYITRKLTVDGSAPELALACASLRKKMLDALKLVNTELLGFSYHPSEIERFSRFVREETDRIMEFGAFARAMDNRKLQAMLKQCSAKEIYDFCSAYTYVYSLPHCGAFLCQDKDALEELSGLVKELETYGGYDRIQQNIIRTFIRALDSISFS